MSVRVRGDGDVSGNVTGKEKKGKNDTGVGSFTTPC